MSRLVFNRTGGAADEYGHLQGLNRLFTGDVIEGLKVQALTSPGMSVVVGQGSGRVSTGTYPTSYCYWVAIDTTTGSPAGESVTITTAPGSNSRIDTIVAYVDLSVTASTSPANNPGMLKVAAVAGTVAGSPTAPSNATIQSVIGASNPFIKPANIAVGTSVTQINNGNITDTRSFVGLQLNNVATGVLRLGLSEVNNAGVVIPNSYTTYNTLTKTSTGGEVELMYGCQLKDGSSGASRTGHIRVQCDGTTVTDSDILWQTAISGQYVTATAIVSHTPTAASHTWTLQVEADTASATTIYQSYLRVQEIR